MLSQRAPTIHSSFLVNSRTPKNVCCSEQNLWLLQIIPGLEEVLAGMRLGGSFISTSKQNMFMPSSWIMLHAELVYEHHYLWSYVWLRRTFVLYIPGKRRALIPPEVGYTDALLEPQPKEVILMFDIHVREFSQSTVTSLVTSQGIKMNFDHYFLFGSLDLEEPWCHMPRNPSCSRCNCWRLDKNCLAAQVKR